MRTTKRTKWKWSLMVGVMGMGMAMLSGNRAHASLKSAVEQGRGEVNDGFLGTPIKSVWIVAATYLVSHPFTKPNQSGRGRGELDPVSQGANLGAAEIIVD